MWRLPVHWNTVWCRKLWAATSCGWWLEVNYIFVGGVSGVVLTAATWRQLNNNETNKNISYLCAARLGVGKCIHFCTLFHLIIGQQRMLRATGASPLARRASHVLPVRWCDAGSIKSHDKLRTTDRRELLVASIMEHCKVDRSISHYAKRLKSCVLYVSFFFCCQTIFLKERKKKSPAVSMFVPWWQNLEAPRGEAATSMTDITAPVARIPISQSWRILWCALLKHHVARFFFCFFYF